MDRGLLLQVNIDSDSDSRPRKQQTKQTILQWFVNTKDLLDEINATPATLDPKRYLNH